MRSTPTGEKLQMQITRFNDEMIRCEVWQLPDAGWDDWAKTVDGFLARALAGISATYAGEAVEWLEVNYWPISGRLIVFPSQHGPSGDRGERVCYELASDHLGTASEQISKAVPEDRQEEEWSRLAARVWERVGECLVRGEAAAEFTGSSLRNDPIGESSHLTGYEQTYWNR